MDIKDIIKSYGFNDYYEMNTGRIFHLSDIQYDKKRDISKIPVTQDEEFIGYINIPGDIKQEIAL